MRAHVRHENPRLLFVSGQVPEGPDGEVPADFHRQCRLAWKNVQQQLAAAGMGVDNLLKVTAFLSQRRHARDCEAVCREVLGARTATLTLVLAGNEATGSLQIEAIAAA